MNTHSFRPRTYSSWASTFLLKFALNLKIHMENFLNLQLRHLKFFTQNRICLGDNWRNERK